MMGRENMPAQIGIIMDGNRRWAKERGLPAVEGHRKGAQMIEPIVKRAGEIGVKGLTLWAFSTENWQRDSGEVSGIMEVFRNALSDVSVVERMLKNNVQVRTIGDTSRFPADIQKGITFVEKRSSRNSGIVANFALNYGGRDEIRRATNKAIKAGKEVTEEEFKKYLDMSEDVDLVIRTGGEQRTSGFLIYQAAPAEQYFTSLYWPDFTPEEFDRAITDYQKRQRRFGK